MADTSISKVIFLDDMIKMKGIEIIGIIKKAKLDNGPVLHLNPDKKEIEKIYTKLHSHSKKNNFQVWKHDEIPLYLNYRSNRVGSIVLLADFGYMFALRKTYDPKHPPFPKGNHGWYYCILTGRDNGEPSMAAILIGHGSRFKNQTIEFPVRNVEVYELLAKLLRIKVHPNNGTGVLVREIN